MILLHCNTGHTVNTRDREDKIKCKGTLSVFSFVVLLVMDSWVWVWVWAALSHLWTLI